MTSTTVSYIFFSNNTKLREKSVEYDEETFFGLKNGNFQSAGTSSRINLSVKNNFQMFSNIEWAMFKNI